MYPVSCVLKKIEWQQQWRGKTFQITFIPPFAPFASHKTSFLCHVATHSGSSCDVCRRGSARRRIAHLSYTAARYAQRILPKLILLQKCCFSHAGLYRRIKWANWQFLRLNDHLSWLKWHVKELVVHSGSIASRLDDPTGQPAGRPAAAAHLQMTSA